MTSGDDVSASFLPNSFENQANLSAAGDSSFSAAPAAALVGDSQRFSKILKDSRRCWDSRSSRVEESAVWARYANERQESMNHLIASGRVARMSRTPPTHLHTASGRLQIASRCHCH